MAAAGKDVGIVRVQQIDLFDRLVSHSLHSIFLSVYLTIIITLVWLLGDRQVRARKVRSSRNSLDDRTQSQRPLGFLVGDYWDDERWYIAILYELWKGIKSFQVRKIEKIIFSKQLK